jgi:hypothetical protein
VQQAQEPFLDSEEVIEGGGILCFNLSGPVEPGAADVGARRAGPGPCGPALGWVQTTVVTAWDQVGRRSGGGGHGRLMAGRAQVLQQAVVGWAGEHDR